MKPPKYGGITYALEQQGHHVELWYASDMPEKQTCSVEISQAGEKIFDGSGRSIHADVVWSRRPGKSCMPNYMYPADKCVSLKEFKQFDDGLWSLLVGSAHWINPLESEQFSSNKILQLKLAQICDFTVPETLISSDPIQIRRFAKRHVKSKIIMKSFLPVSWELPDDQHALVSTAIVPDELLLDDYALSHCPSIFQPLIEKAYEVRATVFGDHIIAAKVDSLSTEEGRLDWRIVPPEQRRITPYKMSSALEAACKKLMKKMGLVFGCLDFIVKKDGEFIFLELNPMGQFLWIEEECPELFMLRTMCSFIVYHNTPFSPVNVMNFPKLDSVLSNPNFIKFSQLLKRNHISPQKTEISEVAIN